MTALARHQAKPLYRVRILQGRSAASEGGGGGGGGGGVPPALVVTVPGNAINGSPDRYYPGSRSQQKMRRHRHRGWRPTGLPVFESRPARCASCAQNDLQMRVFHRISQLTHVVPCIACRSAGQITTSACVSAPEEWMGVVNSEPPNCGRG